MNSTELDNLLDEIVNTGEKDKQAELDALSADFLDSPAQGEASPIVELAEGQIDPRLKLISHSSRTTLHKCPRKFQLYRLSSDRISMSDEKEVEQGVTFAYGSVVGIGIQSVLENKTETQVFIDMFLEWDVDLLDRIDKNKKNFWEACFAIQKFIKLKADGFLDEYELVYYEGKPAVELSFQVILPNGYRYRGYVDGVLRHKRTGEILVLECKTTGGTANPTTYKNSGQAIGYSVVLDKLFPDMSSYKVFYLVYESRAREYKEMYFEKSLLQRALWLQELLIDCEHIDTYEKYDTYPMHGENCLDFWRDCEYLGICTMSTQNLVKPLTLEMVERIETDSGSYMFTVDFFDLVAAQLEKGTGGVV